MASKKTNKVVTESIGDIVSFGYTEFGKYINTSRVFPRLLDGLKPSYRRGIYASYLGGKDYAKSAEVLGNMMKFHPHSTDGTYESLAKFTLCGILEGEGSFGRADILGDSDGPAAARYTAIKVSKKLRAMIEPVLDLVPWQDSEVNGNIKEPSYLPTPFPLSFLVDRVSGLGIGVSAILPTFSMESMYEAYITNDPKKLKYRTKGLKIIAKDSDLDALWKTGKGYLTYQYAKITKGDREVIIEGDPSRFPIQLYKGGKGDDKLFMQYREEGRILIDNLSDKTKPGLLRVYLSPGTRGVDIDWLHKYLTEKATHKETYMINVTDGETVRTIGIREWIDITYNNYINLLNLNRDNKLKSLEFSKKVYLAMPEVVKVFLKDTSVTNEQLAKKTKVDLEIIRVIMSKPIGTLRKTDSEAKIKEIEKEIKALKKFKAEEFIKEHIF